MSIRNLNILSKPGSIAVIGGKWPVWLARRLCQAVTEPLACGALCELMRRVIDKAGNAAFYSRNAAFAHCWAEYKSRMSRCCEDASFSIPSRARSR